MNVIQSLMNNLSYSKKMILISFVFIMPLLVSVAIILYKTNELITQTVTEQEGLDYIKHVRQLYQNLPQHRGMTNAFRNGKREFEPKIMAKREAIVADLAAIDLIEEKYQNKFKTKALWTEIKQDWKALKDKAFKAEPSFVFSEHSRLIAKVHSLMEKVSITSKLNLDPETTAHFIINSLVYKLPTVTEYMGQARGFGSGVVASGYLTTDKQIKLGSLLSRINTASEDVEHDLLIAFEESPQLQVQLESLMTARVAAMDNFMAIAEDEVLTGNLTIVDSTGFFNLGTEAIKANYKIYDALVPVLNDLLENRASQLRSTQLKIIIVMVTALILASLMFISFYRSIVTSIKTLKTLTFQVAGGDLTSQASSNTNDEINEIFEALNSMTSMLNSSMGQVQSSSFSLSESAEQLSKSTDQVAQNIAGQQSQTEHIAASMTEMSATVRDIAQNAELLALEVSNADHETQTGSKIISSTINAINSLADGVGTASTAVASLETSSKEIGSILNVIKEVAEQTNLLALNAAIEAARAGEHGRGFAVVADEVRSLANRTQQSAEQIQQMVNTLQQNTREATTVMSREKQKAEEVSVHTQEATASIQKIVESMNKIGDMSTQVATAAEEQGAVSEEISRNVSTVADFSHSNMSTTKQVSEASAHLAKLAVDLEHIVRLFKVSNN
jgi:methyl-accepting chemotaxis protein